MGHICSKWYADIFSRPHIGSSYLQLAGNTDEVNYDSICRGTLVNHESICRGKSVKHESICGDNSTMTPYVKVSRHWRVV
jgi:hypothetical protein